MKNDLSAEQLQQLVTVTLPLGVVLRITSNGERPVAAPASFAGLPAIGAEFQGGIYAGPSLDNERSVALVLLPGDAEDLTWEQAKAWAAEKEGSLPSRIDQLVLFKNLKSEFKEAAYWSCTPDAGDEAYAWCQGFGSGLQGTSHKTNTLRARAVRRIAI